MATGQRSLIGLVLASQRPFSTVALSVDVGDDGALPTEFRLFKAGANETSKGTFIFDAAAAKSVMADYRAHGADLMIDLEHQSLTDTSSPDPTARDARGWCQLEVRPDGSLWAVNVKWTPDGAARLSERRQRYVSPAFGVDPKTKRVTSILNVAITSIPATHNTPALVAASGGGGSTGMTIDEFVKVCKVLGLDPSTSVTDAMAKIQGTAPAAPESSPDADTEAAPPQTSAAVPPQDANTPPPQEDKKQVAATALALSQLFKLTGATSFADFAIWKASHSTLATETERLAKERQTIELAKRQENAAAFVQLGIETPHTSGLAEGKLAKRLLDEPLDEQTARLSALRTARGATGSTPVAAPPGSAAQGPGAGASQTFNVNGRVVELSSVQLEICAQTKCDPKDFAALLVQRDGV